MFWFVRLELVRGAQRPSGGERSGRPVVALRAQRRVGSGWPAPLPEMQGMPLAATQVSD